jgi:hypothetical protein
MALQNKTDLLALVNANITTNGANGITGAELNAILTNLNESTFNQIDDVHKLFRTYDPTKSYAVGLPCIYAGAIYQCSTATSGAFNALHWTAISGGVSGATDLSVTSNTTTQLTVSSSTGTDATLSSATGSLAGLHSAADKTKSDLFTITGAANIDTMQASLSTVVTNAGNLVTLSGVAANETTLGTFTGVTIADNVTNKVALQSLETAVELRHTGSGTTGYLPKFTGALTQTDSTIYDTGVGTIGLFGVTSPTQSIGMGGDLDRSIGVETRTTANEVGRALSLYSGTATVGATDKNAGSVNILTGNSRGTGTGTINFYTAPAGSSGTGTNAATLKMSINGAGTAEFTTSTSGSKARIGANLDTICGVVQHNGLYLATPDGSYEYPISMSVGTDYRAYFGGGNNGFMFVKNPQSDSHPLVAMGTSVTNISAGCEGSYNYRYQFARVWNNGGNSTSMYVNTTGTNSISANVGLMELVNSVTNVNGSNYGLQISVTGSSTGTNQNVAISTTNGKVVFGATKGDYDVSFGATANRTFGINRETVAAVGRKLTIYGGSACAGNTDLTGGNVEVITGIATGTGSADIIFHTTTPGATGTTDRTPTEKMRIKGAGNVGIGTSTPNEGAILDLTSSTMALLIPRLTGDGASGITPTNGMLLYATSTNGTFTSTGFWGYEGGAWKKFTLV